MPYEIVKHTRDYSRETRTGRVITGLITTWDVIHVEQCSLVSEHPTKREALAAVAALQASPRK